MTKIIEIDGFQLPQEEWETLVDYTNFINLQPHVKERIRDLERRKTEETLLMASKRKLDAIFLIAQNAREITKNHPKLPILTILKYKHKTII